MRLRDTHAGVSRVHPAPFLDAEVLPWVKPAANAVFPLNPVGATVLYDRAQQLLTDAQVRAALSEDERSRLDGECRRLAATLFRPGVSIRLALDQLVEERALRPNLTGMPDADKLGVLRLANLAAWAVFRAACSWAEEAA